VSVNSLGKQRIGFNLLLPTLATILFTTGLGMVLIFYLLTVKVPGQSLDEIFVQHALYADEGVKYLSDGQQEAVLRGLIITSITVRTCFESFSGAQINPFTASVRVILSHCPCQWS
jgi:hypothetical protein